MGSKWLACSLCFRDAGLNLGAKKLGVKVGSPCPNCGRKSGHKLTESNLVTLAYRFFVWGSLVRCEYGAAPRIQFNDKQSTSISVPRSLEDDVALFENKLGVGFFYYGPRLWMIGEVEPLKELQATNSCHGIIKRIISEYPTRSIDVDDSFYRVRISPNSPEDWKEYDSPPPGKSKNNRLNGQSFPVLYGSPDLEVCVHECRITAEDELYVATLAPAYSLSLLDLTGVLDEGGSVTEFESLDMAIHMLFLAGEHSYVVSQNVAKAAKDAGYDGIIYPSYFSLLKTGTMPLETAYGLSYRRFPKIKEYEESKIIRNLAIFGHPIKEKKVRVQCINRLLVKRAEYDFLFGPVGV